MDSHWPVIGNAVTSEFCNLLIGSNSMLSNQSIPGYYIWLL